MKKLAILMAAILAASSARAAIYTYDFGTGTGSHTSSDSTTFLPQPATGGGDDRVRVGTGGGGFYLENPGDEAVGSGTELRIVAPTSTSLNKFQVYDYTAAKSFSLGMTVKMFGGSSGEFILVVGDGASYSDNNNWAGSQTFAGLRWVYGASDAITTSYRNLGSWSSLSGDPFEQGSVFNIEIYGNNTTDAINYTRGTAQSVAVNTWDLWVNGTLIGNDLAKAQLANDSNIDSFMIVGQNSAGNVANIIVDNITYANGITVIPEPSTFGLLGLAGVAALIRRHRSRR